MMIHTGKIHVLGHKFQAIGISSAIASTAQTVSLFGTVSVRDIVAAVAAGNENSKTTNIGKKMRRIMTLLSMGRYRPNT